MIHFYSERNLNRRLWSSSGFWCAMRNGMGSKSISSILIFHLPNAKTVNHIPIFTSNYRRAEKISMETTNRKDTKEVGEMEREAAFSWRKDLPNKHGSVSYPNILLIIFSLPKWAKREIDSLRSRFLWGDTKRWKAFCLVNWKRVCKCKEFGGLKITNQRDFNKALLIKWWWKLFDKPGRRWATLVAHNCRLLAGWWSDICTNMTSSLPFWKGICSIKEIFLRGIAKEVKNGRAMRFW